MLLFFQRSYSFKGPGRNGRIVFINLGHEFRVEAASRIFTRCRIFFFFFFFFVNISTAESKAGDLIHLRLHEVQHIGQFRKADEVLRVGQRLFKIDDEMPPAARDVYRLALMADTFNELAIASRSVE